jgi:hypothetical protein
MAENDYSPAGYLVYKGGALTEVMEVTFKAVSNDKLVETLVKGASGHSDGATKVECSMKNAIPKAGLESDMLDVCINKRTIKLRFRIANFILTARGRILNYTLSTSVNNPNSFDVEFEGGKPEKQAVS